MTPIDVHLVAWDVLEVACQASSFEEAQVRMQLELEVLSRDDLMRVATAMAWETTSVLAPRAVRPALLERLQRRRVTVMVGPLNEDGSR